MRMFLPILLLLLQAVIAFDTLTATHASEAHLDQDDAPFQTVVDNADLFKYLSTYLLTKDVKALKSTQKKMLSNTVLENDLKDNLRADGDLRLSESITRDIETSGNIVIEDNVHIKGNVHAGGCIIVYGSIIGNVHSDDYLAIFKGANIEGEEVNAGGYIAVNGKIKGKVYAGTDLTIFPDGEIVGEENAGGSIIDKRSPDDNPPLVISENINHNVVSVYGEIIVRGNIKGNVHAGGQIFLWRHGKIIGNVKSVGKIDVWGNIKGNVHAGGDIVLWRGGKIVGNVKSVGMIYVWGTIKGNVHAGSEPSIYSDGKIVGNVHVGGDISISEDGNINGNVHVRDVNANNHEI